MAQRTGEFDIATHLPQYDTLQAIGLLARPQNNSRDTTHLSRVQFASTESLAKAGVDVDVVHERPMTDAIAANGELIFDPTCVAHLSPRAPGAVAAVLKSVGDPVAAGEILGVIDASLVGQAKSQLLQAVVQMQLRRATTDRLKPIASSGAVAQKSAVEAEGALREAEVALIAARQALENLGFELPEDLESLPASALAAELRFLGLSPDLANSLAARTKSANLIPIRAPREGVLIASEVVAGEVVDTAKPLFTVSDPRRMWLMLNVRQEDARYIRLGMPVRFVSDSGDQQVTGNISWINPAIDATTRSLHVRVTVVNNDGTLRDRTFGSGQIIVREEPRAVVVPREAVQSTADAHFVFVRDKRFFDKAAPKFFHVRQVRLGARDDHYVELLAGVLPGEVVASKGSNVLLAQLLYGTLGAGCGCHDR
jgi:cobalt-zinc-cadmium efflux system membrane fusion protein